MKNIWAICQLILLCLSIACLVLQNGMANEYLIMSFEIAILYKLESEGE